MRLNTHNTWPEVFELSEVRVIDGDSIEAFIDLPFGVSLKRIIRLRGFYAPELGGRSPTAAIEASKRLASALDSQKAYLHAHRLTHDNHGRIVAQLIIGYCPVDGRTILGELQMTEAEHKIDLRYARGAGVKIGRSL